MSEIREIKTQQLDQKCPVCGNGWMRPTGLVYTSGSPQFPHKCNACGFEQTYAVRYPYIVQE